MKKTLRPYRFGSDCEFGFMEMDKLWNYKYLPANEVLRVGNTQTFIGTDGHRQTGEIRPRPSHNVYQHIMDLANGLCTLQKWLQGSKKTKEVWIQALPFYQGETYGGHIHCSFIYQNNNHELLQKLGLTWNRDHFEGDPNVTPDDVAPLAEAAAGLATVKHPSADEFLKVMNFLLKPFEYAVQPWDLRVARNQVYGRDNDCRVQGVTPPKHLRQYLYQHLEYRLPSTWLGHPDLAYCYMALAKLLMLNFDMVLDLSVLARTSKLETSAVSRDIFQERYRQIAERQPVLTTDLKGLDAALTRAFLNCNIWFQPLKPIAMTEWAKFSSKGGM